MMTAEHTRFKELQYLFQQQEEVNSELCKNIVAVR